MEQLNERKLKRPKKSFWWVNSIGWFCMTIVNIVFQTEFFTENFEAIGYSFLITVPSFCFTLLIRYIVLKFRIIEKPIAYLIPSLIGITIVATMLCVVTFSALIAIVYPQEMDSISDMIRSGFQFGLLILIWILFYSGFLFFENQQRLNEEQLKLSLKLKEAELNNLRKQLSPHFLFNSLNNIHSLIRIDPEKAREAILNISDLLRYVLNYQKNETVTIEEEMQIVNVYIQLNGIHLGKNVRFDVAIDSELNSLSIPPLSIQLLVENAIKHGKITNGSVISVKGFRSGEKWVIEVTNPGTINKKDGDGIGIVNLSHRLKTIFGQKADFKIFEKENSVVSQIIIG